MTKTLIQCVSSLFHSQCTTDPQCFLAYVSHVAGPDNPRSGAGYRSGEREKDTHQCSHSHIYRRRYLCHPSIGAYVMLPQCCRGLGREQPVTKVSYILSFNLHFHTIALCVLHSLRVLVAHNLRNYCHTIL